MLPSAAQLLSGLAFPLRRKGLAAVLDPQAIAAVLAEAERLSGGDERVEPAALFYACARRPRVFGPASFFVVPFLAQTHANAIGLVLDVDDTELTMLHTRALRHELGFEELRDRFNNRLRPP